MFHLYLCVKLDCGSYVFSLCAPPHKCNTCVKAEKMSLIFSLIQNLKSHLHCKLSAECNPCSEWKNGNVPAARRSFVFGKAIGEAIQLALYSTHEIGSKTKEMTFQHNVCFCTLVFSVSKHVLFGEIYGVEALVCELFCPLLALSVLGNQMSRAKAVKFMVSMSCFIIYLTLNEAII